RAALGSATDGGAILTPAEHMGSLSLKSRVDPKQSNVQGAFQNSRQLRSCDGRAGTAHRPDRIGPTPAGATARGLRARRRTAEVLPRETAGGRRADQGARRGRAQALGRRVKLDLKAWSAERLAQVERALSA